MSERDEPHVIVRVPPAVAVASGIPPTVRATVSIPPAIHDEGTVASRASFTSQEAIADEGTVRSRMIITGEERVVGTPAGDPPRVFSRAWLSEESYILGHAGAGGFLGQLYGGKLWATIGFFACGVWGVYKVSRPRGTRS